MRPASAVLMLSLLAGCARGGSEAAPAPGGDPLLDAALAAPLATDEDLASSNRANAVASLPDPDGSVPSLDVGPDAIGRARADALALVGGTGEMRQAPAATRTQAPLPPEASLSAAARAAHTPGAEACAGKVQYTAAWAARMPAAFPVYPRGAVQEAAGTDSDGCTLRAINFQTPVPLGEVIDFYYSRARQAGFSAERIAQGGDDVLGGTKGGATYRVYARKLASGASEVDLVTSG